MKKKNSLVLCFAIWDFEDISHATISEKLDLVPEKILVKGEKRNPRNLNPDSPQIKNNGWLLGSGLDEYSSFEDQMNNLLNMLEPKIDVLEELCQKYACEFSCALFVYKENGESTPSVHLDGRYNNFIKQLNIEFDLDLYVF
jgi:hypothetical protein